MTSPEGQGSARIYDQGYRPWTGELASIRTRFLPIAWFELHQAWREKWFKRLVWVSFMPLLVLAVLVVINARLPLPMDQAGGIWIIFWSIQMFFSMLVVYFVGRGALGEDLRTGALAIYFSRPVSFTQYLLGKWLAIAVGVAGVTLLPGLVLSVFRWLAEPESTMGDFLAWTGWLLLLCALLCLTMGTIMLAVSSLTRRERAAGIVWVILFMVSAIAAKGLAEATGLYQLEAIGFSQANLRLAEILFGARGSAGQAFWYLIGQLGWIAASLAIVLFRLRRWLRV